MKIFKYPLQVAPINLLQLPKESKIIHVAIQMPAGICLWCEVPRPDDIHDVEERKIVVYGTGHEIPDSLKVEHLGTVMDGPYVWHVYEEIKE